jgi:phage tail-like protein
MKSVKFLFLFALMAMSVSFAQAQRANFKVVFQNKEMYFRDLSGITPESQNTPSKGGSTSGNIKMPGINKKANATLKKGTIKNNLKNSDWYNQLTDINKKGSMDIYMLDEAGNLTIHWVLTNAFCVKLISNNKNAVEPLIETMDVAYDSLTQK